MLANFIRFAVEARAANASSSDGGPQTSTDAAAAPG
jgi:hypothetical protein